MLVGTPAVEAVDADADGIDPRLTGAERADEIWRVRTRRRWQALTKDLDTFCKDGSIRDAELEQERCCRLDQPSQEIQEELMQARGRLTDWLGKMLLQYDSEEAFRERQDNQFGSRDVFEDHLRSEAVRDLRKVISRCCSRAGPRRKCYAWTQRKLGQLWQVVGGTKDGGILVRGDFPSKVIGRLSTGSVVEELDLSKDRLQYRLLQGNGPSRGWVSILLKVNGEEKPLVTRLGMEEELPEHATAASRTGPRAPLLIIGLMAVHISSEARLKRLEHTLRSVGLQDVPRSEAEFLFSVSWSASTEDLEERLQATLEDLRPSLRSGVQFLSTKQTQRHSQFQHLKAALGAARAKLQEGLLPDQSEEAYGSVWAIFGDDDDIWHRRRVAECVHAIHSHSMIDGVAVFATTTRVNCNARTTFKDEDMPQTDVEVDSFLRVGKGQRQDLEAIAVAWCRRYEESGDKAPELIIPGDLHLEYFDFCPRLWVLEEFLERTSPCLLEHKYCDLRFSEFLSSYTQRGREMGLEVAFFRPRCWMLFYATPVASEKQWERVVEQLNGDTNCSLQIDVNNGHMSTSLEVQPAEQELAERMCAEFREYEPRMTAARLARYWAAFRNIMEMYLVKKHGLTIDQRLLDLFVFLAINNSFFRFADKLQTMADQDKAETAERMMYYVGQGFGKALAMQLGVHVFWVRPDIFLGRDFYYSLEGLAVPLLGLHATNKNSSVGRLEVGLPKQPGSSNRWLTVDASDVNVIMTPVHVDAWDVDIEAIEEAASCRRQRLLRGLSQHFLTSALERNGGSCADSCSPNVLQLLRWVRIDIRRVHFRYEDPVTNPRFMFSGGVMIQRFTFGDAPLAGDELPPGQEVAYSKQAVLQVSAYWQSYAAELLAGAPQWEVHMSQAPPCCEQEEERGTWPAFEVLPLTDVEVAMSCPCLRTGAKLGVSISAAHLVPRLTQAMLNDIQLVTDLATRWWALQLQRCECSTRLAAVEPLLAAEAGPAAQWQRARRCVCRLLRERDPVRHWLRKEVHDLLRLQRLYLDLVVQELVELKAAMTEEREASFDTEVSKSVAWLERVLPLQLLVAWRWQAGRETYEPEEDAATAGCISAGEKTPTLLSFSLTVRRLGIGVQEIAVPNPLKRIPFDIVSRSAYTSAFQSADWPQTHPVVERATAPRCSTPSSPSSPCERRHQQRKNQPWVYLSDTDSQSRLLSGAQGPRAFEVLLRQVHVRSELFNLETVLGRVQDVRFDTEFSVQQVQVGRPASKQTSGLGVPLLSGAATPERPAALSCTWQRKGGRSLEHMRLALGEWVLGCTRSSIEESLFLLFDLLPPRSGVQLHRCQNSLMPLALPTLRCPLSLGLGLGIGSRNSTSNSECFLSLACFRARAVVAGANAAAAGDMGPLEALLELRELDLAMTPMECNTSDPGGRSWSCTFVEGLFSLPPGAVAPPAGTGPISQGGCGVAGGSVRAQASAVQVLGTERVSGSLAQLSLCVPKAELSVEEGRSLKRFLELSRNISVSALPRLENCIMASRVRLWYPPAHPTMRPSRMRKEGPASSESDSSDQDGTQNCGHWSCDMWAELLPSGALTLYSHPRLRTPIYTLWPLEVRGGGGHGPSAPSQSRQHSQRRSAQEMEVRIVLSSATPAEEPLSVRPPSSPQSAWIYLRCVDEASHHWVRKWQLLQASWVQQQPRFGAVPTAVTSGRPKLQVMKVSLLEGELHLAQPFEPQLRAQLRSLASELDFRLPELQLTLGDLLLEHLEHDAAEARHLLLGAAAPRMESWPRPMPQPRPQSTGNAALAASCSEFLALQLSLASGGYLRVWPLQVCFDPMWVFRVAHLWLAWADFGLRTCEWPLLGSLPQAWPRSLQPVTATDSFDFTVSLPALEIRCVQCFTRFQVGLVDLRDVRMLIQDINNPTKAVSLDLPVLRVLGHSGACLFHSGPRAPGAVCAEAVEHFFHASCRWEPSGAEWMHEEACEEPQTDLRVLRLACRTSPSVLEWRHEECCRFREFAVDLWNALSWSGWRASKCWSSWWPRDSTDILQVDADVRLPDVRTTGDGDLQLPTLEISLGQLRVDTVMEKEYPFPATTSSADMSSLPACVLHLQWHRVLAVCLPDETQEATIEGERGHSGSSGHVSEGTTVTARFARELVRGSASQLPGRSWLELQGPEVLTFCVPPAALRALWHQRGRSLGGAGGVLVAAPRLPGRRQTWLARASAPQSAACGTVSASFLQDVLSSGRAELAGLRVELVDPEAQPWLTLEVLQLTHRHHGLGAPARPGSLKLAVAHIGVRSPMLDATEPTEVLRLKRSAGMQQDLQMVLGRTQKANSSEAHETSVDAWELLVHMGAPTFRLSAFLVGYLRHLTDFFPVAATGETGTTTMAQTASAPMSTDEDLVAAEGHRDALLLLRQAQAMASLHHRQLLLDMANYDDPQNNTKAEDLPPPEVLHRPCLSQAPQAASEGVVTTFHVELPTLPWTMELLVGVSMVAASASGSLSAQLTGKLQGSGWEALCVFNASQCQLGTGCGKDAHLVVEPLSIGARAQLKSSSTLVWANVEEGGCCKVKAWFALPALTVVLRFQDLLALEEWLGSLTPSAVATGSNEPGADLRCDHSSSPSLRVNVQTAGASRWSAIRSWFTSGSSLFRNFSLAELNGSIGGLSLTFSDGEGPVLKWSMRPTEIHHVPTQQAASRQTEHQSQAVVELEAWNSWARAWEPLLEPCEITAVLTLMRNQRALTVHCTQVRCCFKLHQLQEIRRCVNQADFLRQRAQTRWHAQLRELWRISTGDGTPHWPLALGDLFRPAVSLRRNAQDGLEGASSSREPSTAQRVAGPALRVRNLTGCTLSLQGRPGTGRLLTGDTSNLQLAPGKECEVGCVGTLALMEVLLQSPSSQQQIQTAPIRVQMACSAPGIRALPTPWADVFLWQEVLASGAGVLCRFRSPVVVSNETPLEMEIEYGAGIVQRCPVGDKMGLNLAALTRGVSLRVRPVLQEYGGWSGSIALPLEEGAGSLVVLSCGPRCELVAEVSISDVLASELPGATGGRGRVSLELRPRCSICNMLPIPFQVRAASSCWPSGIEDGSSLEVRPGETQAAMASTLGQSHLWLSLSLGGRQASWSLPQCVPLNSRPDTPTLVAWDVRHAGDAAGTFQVEIRSLPALHGRGLAPRIILALCSRHVVLLQCPFQLRLLAPVSLGSHMTRLAPVNLGKDPNKPLMWLVHSKVFELHCRIGPGSSAAVHTDLVLEGGSLAGHVGQHDIVITKVEGPIVPFAESETICLTVLPRYWIMNHLRFNLEVKQVDAGAELGDVCPLVIPAGAASPVSCAGGEEVVPAVVLRTCRRSSSSTPDAWSGAVGLCSAHRSSLMLRNPEQEADRAVWVQVLRQTGGQWVLHVSPGTRAEILVENHTNLAVLVRQLHAENSVCRLPALSTTLFAWHDALELARCITTGRQAVLQVQSERWRAGEWLSLDPYVLCRCSVRHGDTPVYAHVRREGSVQVVVVTSNQCVRAWQDPAYIDFSPSSLEARLPRAETLPSPRQEATRHVRGTVAELSVSLVGTHSELFRLTAFGLALGADCFERRQKLLCTLDFLRLDHLAPGVALPCLLRTAPTGNGPFLVLGAAQELEPQVPFLACCSGGPYQPALSFPPPSGEEQQMLMLEYLDVRANEFFLGAHVRSVMLSALPFLVAIFGDNNEAIREIIADDDSVQQLALSNYCGMQALRANRPIAGLAPAAGLPLYVRVGDLRLSSADMGLEVSLRDFDPSILGSLCFTPAEVKRTLRRLSHTDFRGERVALEGLEWRGVAAALPTLMDALGHHYAHTLRNQLHEVLATGAGASSADAYGVADYLLQGLHSFVGAPPDSLEEVNAREAQCPFAGTGTSLRLRASPTQRFFPGGGMCLGRICGRSLALQVLGEDTPVQPVLGNGSRSPVRQEQQQQQQQQNQSALRTGGAAWPRANQGHTCSELLPLESGSDAVAEGLRSVSQALFGMLLRPLAGVLRPNEGSSEASRAAGGSRSWADAAPPPPRLLRGPHRLARPRRQEDEEAQRVLAELAFELGTDTCYEDHALAHDAGRIVILTDSELLLVWCSPAHVERRWRLDGVEPGSVRLDGTRVFFTAEMGVTDDDELRVGPSTLRCATPAGASGLTAALRTAAMEAQAAGARVRQWYPEMAAVVVSL